MRFAGRLARVARGLALSAILGLAPSLAGAAERHAIVTEGADYFGRDIETIKDVSVEDCEKACVADAACKAFTYNVKARWCFKKANFGDLRQFAGAISGRIVEGRARPVDLERIRTQELGDLVSTSYVDESRQLAGQIQAIDVPGTLDEAMRKAVDASMAGDAIGATQRYREALRLAPERFDIWEAFSAAAFAVTSDTYDIRDRANREASGAAIAAYQRAESDDERARALARLASALAKREDWKSAIRVARQSIALQADESLQASLDGWVAQHGFRVTDNTVDTASADPRICLVFSDPIAKDDPRITDFVSVDGGEKLAVEAEEQQICISGVTYGERYRVTVRQGLPAADGRETIAKTAEIESYIRDRDPMVRFVGKGYVLPKSPEATIPVVTINVDVLSASVVRIGDRNLVREIGDGTFLRQLGTWDIENIAGSRGQPVWTGEVLVKRQTNREVTTGIPVGEIVRDAEPGVYAMIARQKDEKDEWGEKATQWFIVTDVGLSSMTGNDGLHAVVRSLSSAGPLAGVPLKLVAVNNEVLGTATTDAEGYARFDGGLVKGTGGNAPALLVADGPNGDYAFLDLTRSAFDLADRGVEGRPSPEPVDVFLTAERGVYRTGEAVHLTALMRDARAVAATDLPLTIIVTRPDGVEHLRRFVKDAGEGGRSLSVDLPAEAMRGTWRAAAYTDPKGGQLAETTFLVEDFQPERIDFSFTADATELETGTDVEASLDARWLYGAPAANLSIEGEVYVTKADGIPTAPGFRFGLADEEFTPVAEPIQGGPTDEEGKAAITLVTPDLPDATVPLTAAVHVRVLDTNGRPVERRKTLPVSSGYARIGVDPLFDGEVEQGGNARFNVITLDAAGERANAAGLTWTLSKIDTNYQWYLQDGSWNYEPIRSTARVANGTLDVAAGQPARIETRVEWGEYELLVEDPAGEALPVSMTFYAGWYVAPSAEDTPDLLKITLDKPRYAVGETLTAHVAPRFEGVALVSVVDDRLIAMKTVEVGPEGATVSFPVTEDWGPGAYVTARLLRPMDVAARRNPARALGLAWATVDPGDRELEVAVTAPSEMRPRTALPVEVALANVRPGEEAFITVAAVDVGILNLTGFTPPAPEDWYFAQRQLGMEFRDVYGQLIDGMLGTRGEVRSGGDGGGINRMMGPPPTERLVAFYQGVTAVDADGKARASFDIPDFNGTIKVMVIAWSKSAVGHGTADVLVRDPVVIAASLPAFLAPDDRSRLRLDLTHVQGPAGDFKLEVFAAGDHVRLDGALANRIVPIADKGTATVLIPIDGETVGDETLTVALTGPDGTRLTKTLALGVRDNEPPVTRVTVAKLAGRDGKLTLGPDLLTDLRPGTTTATVTVGTVAGIDLPGLVQSLDRYPYGCTEQITSRALPLVYLDDVILAAGLTGDEPVRQRVQEAIEAVLVNQGSNGSFGLWSPGSEDLWLNAYVTDFLTRAREKGYEVPAIPFDLAVTNLKNRIAYAPDFASGGEDVAYALYVLARNGRASIGDLRYYAESKLDAFSTPLSKAQLAAALSLYGDTDKAATVFRNAVGMLQDRIDSSRLWRADYGSDLRDGAAILTLSSEVKARSVDTDNLIKEIADLSRKSTWTSTQEQAWMLLAANAVLNDGKKPEVTINGVDHVGVFTARYSDAALRSGDVLVENRGEWGVDAKVTVTGVPTAPEPAGGNGYSIARRYYDLDGNEVDPSAVKLGARLAVVVTVQTTESGWARLMVDDPLPAGFAIDNPSLLSAGDVSGLSFLTLDNAAARTEFRADRFLAALDLQGNQTEYNLAYMVRAVAPGLYAQPAARVLDMYRPEKQARTDSGQVEVVGPLQ